MSYQLPSESELVLLSLDYLRDLRRAYANKEDLLRAEGLDADWLTLAIFALNRSFSRTKSETMTSTSTLPLYLDSDVWKSDSHPLDCSIQIDRLPSIQTMTDEVVYAGNPNGSGNADSSHPGIHPNPTLTLNLNLNLNDPQDEDLEAFAWYEYDDAHPSNQHRYYLLHGLGGGARGPLLLGEIAAAGLHQLQAKSRHAAEKEIVDSPLFDQFLQAVKSKGFFKDAENENPLPDPILDQQRLLRKQAVYQARLEKVVAKFRTKLAFKADPSGDSDSDTVNLSDAQYSRRLRNCLTVRKNRHNESIAMNFSTAKRLQPGSIDPQDIQEAERLKNVGNAHMQRKDYSAAADAYTQALRLSPAGPNSHVYFSNRAAALLSMKKFPEAISDSERSLALKPDYGKAHARLGLAHFLLGDYKPAMEAYTVALKYEPDNKSSRSYLEKAKKRLSRQDEQTIVPGSSFSVVSEWDKSQPLSTTHSRVNVALPTPTSTDAEQREAEKAKVLGNQLMAQRQYQQAYEAYTKALQYSPNGSQSHVYYSNRAAALCYLERYEEAAHDSQKSLHLKPEYGKAHARLGLSRFFMNDFPGAIQAYNAALIHDPNNAASKSYLAKAKLKWEQQGNLVASQVGSNEQHTMVLDVDTRRLMNDPDMQKMAKKAMATTPTSGAQLLEDPEMIRIARKAVNDPSMMAAVKAVGNH
jgi:tetratricopeptide (TPR) repeat protein